MTTKRLRYPLVLAGVLIAAGFLTFNLFIAVGSSRALLAGGAIEGTVTYYGSLPGPQTIQLSVYTTTLQPLPAPVATAQTTSEERAYTLSGMDDGTYYVFAYLDVDDGSDYDPGDEPFAWYDYEGDGRADPVTVQGGTVKEIDILLTDLWRPLGGPLGQANALAAGPELLYAVIGSPHGGANTRIYTSTDEALSWTPVYTRTDQTIRALAFSGTVAYAAGESAATRGLILKSEDGGAGWTEVFSGTGQSYGVFRAVAAHPLTPTVALATGWEIAPPDYVRVGVAYHTTNGGADWTRVLTVPEGDLLALALHPLTPTLVYAGGYYKEGSSQIAAVYRSTDGGAGWSTVLTATEGPGQQFTALAVHPLTPTLVYAGSQTPKYVYRSTDGGASWSEVLYDRGYRLALDPPTTVYAGDDWRELARSTDGGLTGTWTLRVGDLTPGIIEALAVDPSSAPGALYLGLRDNGIYTSADGGLTWSAGNAGITATTAPVDIALDPQNRTRLFVATSDDGGWRTGDGGRTWERQVWSPTHAFAVHPQDSSVIYAATAAGVLRSEDGGDTFAPSYTGAVEVHALAIAAADPDVVYAGGEGGGDAILVRSGDGGASWSTVFTLTEGTVRALAVHPSMESVAYAGVEDRSALPSTAALYRTTDGGAGWTTVYTGGFGAVHTIAIDPEQPDVLYATDDRQVLKSSDGGETWTAMQTYAESNRNLLTVDPRMGDHLYLAGPGYIAESLDGGQSWSDWTAPINQGTAGRSATALAVGGGGITQTLYAGFDGVWAYDRPAPQSSDFTTERVLGDLSQPTAVDWAPDGRMFIAHQDGRVLLYDDGALTTFVDISDEVNNNWNRGLIGIEIHPSFPVTPYVYLLYTYDPPALPGPDSAVDGKDGNGARVSRLLRVTANASQDYNVALPGSERVILGTRSTLTHTGNPASAGGEDWNDPACTHPDGTPVTDCLPSEGPSHSVGWLEFGHDGSLFVTNGEGAPYINPDPRAVRSQDLDSLGGKVLRIDPETGEGLPDNPFYDGDPASNRSRVWALGLRNPFRFALHPVSDTLYVGDVGWYSWEELNTGRALNFGWPCYEGGASGNVRHSLYEPYTGTEEVCSPLYAEEPDNDVAAPRYAYQNLQGAAIVAGDFYTGTRYPATYRGALFVADYDKRWIKYLTFDGEGDATAHDFLESVSELGGPVQLTLGPDGYLYYVVLNPNPSGPSEIRRVLYTSAPSVQVEASPLYGYPPLTVHFTGTLSTHSEQALNYAWSFGDGGSSAHENPTHTYTLSGTYTAALTVTTPQGRSSSDRVRIVVGDSPPAPLILTPTAGSAYTMGTALTFRGQATDVEDTGGDPLPASNLQWNARIFYNGHFHPDFYKATGVSSGTLQVPLHNDNTTLFICLTAVDSQDLQATTCVELQPRTATYTFDTDPSGLRLSYDGSSYVTPFTIEMMVNAPRSIAAPLQQNGLTFIGWSDGGRANHEIVGQPLPQLLLATYRIRTWLPLVLREG